METTIILKTSGEERPGVRFFARMVDHILYVFPAFLILNTDSLLQMYISFYISIVIIEGLLLSTWGYTPGKYLFAVQVRRANSEKLSFVEGAKRTWLIIFEGLWLMIPPLSIIGGFTSFVRLSKKGKTSWDEKGGFTVTKTRK